MSATLAFLCMHALAAQTDAPPAPLDPAPADADPDDSAPPAPPAPPVPPAPLDGAQSAPGAQPAPSAPNAFDPAEVEPDPWAPERLVLSGKGELLAVSSVAGAYTAGLLATEVAAWRLFTVEPAGFLFAVTAGGALGLAGSGAAVVLNPRMSPATAHMIRAGLTLGGVNSVCVFALRASSSTMHDHVAAEMFGALALTSVAGVAASFAPLPESAGPMALSGMTWLPTLAALGANAGRMYDLGNSGVNVGLAYAGLVAGAANAGFLAGVGASFFVPLRRTVTWGIDVGGALGLGTGFAIATFLRAGTPAQGYGTVAFGTVTGMLVGGLVAHAATEWLVPSPGSVPSQDEPLVAPLALTDVRGTPLVGVTVGMRLGP